MLDLTVSVWWLGYWTCVGLCVGSFLNVVIYRLPRGKSLRSPLWSACPHCHRRINWYDNLPLISFLLLRGRCRHCRVPIATRYVVVEASMAIVVLLIVDAFFVGHVRLGLCETRFGLTDQLASDWPILLAHVILFACLFSMSAIDLEHYWVDVRFTNLATLAGFVLHMWWTPKHSADWIRPFDTTAVMSLLTVAGLGLVWIVLAAQPHADPEDFGESEPVLDMEPTLDQAAQPSTFAAYTHPSRALGWACGLMLCWLLGCVIWADVAEVSLRYPLRALPALVLFFIIIVRESTVVREADSRIVDEIYEERHGARSMVLTELGLLLPAIAFAIVGYWIMTGGLAERISDSLHVHGSRLGGPMLRGWMPLYGLATAASGYVIAGALGWGVRIVFTLVLGKEAFGAGDIHLMAATGCIAGWPIVVLGFILACGLAIVGWLMTLPFKRTRAVPLGPWLSLSFLATVIFYESLLQIPVVARATHLARLWFP